MCQSNERIEEAVPEPKGTHNPAPNDWESKCEEMEPESYPGPLWDVVMVPPTVDAGKSFKGTTEVRESFHEKWPGPPSLEELLQTSVNTSDVRFA